MLYKVKWAGLSEPFWERERDLQHSCTHILRYWACAPDQHRQTNRLCRRIHIGAAQSEPSGHNGERVLAPDYACVTRAGWLHRFRDIMLLNGTRVCYKGDDGL